ncbi:MAG: xanthine dehydrogenase family protein molybdopterin-binding subunit, partial [Hyphomicrobiaceae bacterium]
MRYCSGDFPDLLDRALAAADWSGLAQRKMVAKVKGMLRGGGVGMFVEISGGVPNERAKMRLKPGGVVQVRTTLGASGQGHETIFAMLADEQLGIGADNIVLAPADSTGFEDGGGASASRSTQMAGLAIRQSALGLIADLKSRAADRFGVDVASVAYADGWLSVPGTNHAMSLGDLVSNPADEIEVEARIESENSWPGGCHVAEVDIDPETGAVTVVNFVAVDDCGRVIHHEMAEGQVHGALAQGFGQVLMENGTYDPESGQLVAGSLMDYALPRARDLPHFTSILAPSPATCNPLGVKGVGESGTVGPLPAIMAAVRDALAPLGVRDGDIEMPVTPARVWTAIAQARARQ